MTIKSERPHVAIASCSALPHLTGDDLLLRDALETHGMRPVPVIWDSEVIDWSVFDACIVRSVWDYHLKHEDFLTWADRVGNSIPVWNPTELMAWNSDKTYLRRLERDGVPTIPTQWLERRTKARLADILSDCGWEEAVLKPTVDLGAMNLHRVRRERDGDQAVLENLLADHSVMVQPFLDSLQEHGETSLIYVEGELSHVVRKRPGDGDFRVQPCWGGSSCPVEPSAAELEVAHLVLRSLETPPLYARVDLVPGPEGPCLIELELVDPNLFLREHPPAARLLASRIEGLLGR